MDVLIYSFLIVTGAAGASYYLIRQRYTRLLEEEQEKSFALRNSELQLASEKQRLETALKEKEQQIASTRAHILTEESKAGSLSSEVLTKEKQIQSLTAQLQHETQQRTALQTSLDAVEQQLTDLRTKIAAIENHSSALRTDVAAKEQRISALTAELQHQTAVRQQTEQTIAEQRRAVEEFNIRIAAEEERRSALAQESAAALAAEQEQQHRLRGEMEARERQWQSTLEQTTMELQQRYDALQREAEELRAAGARAQETIREQQHQSEQLQNELGSTRGANASLNASREQIAAEFRANETALTQRLEEKEREMLELHQELERTSTRLREEESARIATEHALQESKQKLYAHIAELEQRGKEQANAIAAMQQQLSELQSDLDAADRSIHNLLRLFPLPLFVVNDSGICEFCNPALEELAGYGMQELADRHFSRLFPEEDRTFYEEQWSRTENRTEQFQGETRVVAATGDPIPATVGFVEIRPGAETLKYVGFIVDRTMEKDSRRHYAAAKEKEQELSDLKSRFIGMVSNQLRTSLVTIAANTELLERFLDKWSEERRYLAFLRINDSLRQMIELVRDVTFTTQASAQGYTVTLSDVNLESLFQRTAQELAADLESKHRFILSERGDVASVRLDEHLLSTIARQLLSNAFKYSKESTEVHVYLEQEGPSCTIRVTDQGIGIPAAEQKHLFSSFFRASNVANIYGTGLGLTIVQQCVQMLGGSIAVESQLNKGTTVTVTLPLPSAA